MGLRKFAYQWALRNIPVSELYGTAIINAVLTLVDVLISLHLSGPTFTLVVKYFTSLITAYEKEIGEP